MFPINENKLLEILHKHVVCHDIWQWNKPEYQYFLYLKHGEGYCTVGNNLCDLPIYFGRILPNDGKDRIVILHRQMTISENSPTPPVGLESEMIWYPRRFDLIGDVQDRLESLTYMVNRGNFIDPRIYIVYPDDNAGLPDPAHLYGYSMHTHIQALFITPKWHNAVWIRSPLVKSINGLDYAVDKIISNKHYDNFSVTSSSLSEIASIEFEFPLNVYKLGLHISLDGGGTSISSAKVTLESSEDGITWDTLASTTGCPASVDHRLLGLNKAKVANIWYTVLDTPKKIKYIRVRAQSDGTNKMNLRLHIITAWVKRNDYRFYGIEPTPWDDCKYHL